MGGMIDSLFGGGGAKQAGKSIDFMKQVYGENKALATPWATGGLGMFDNYANMLGGEGQDAAFQKWLGSSDYNFTTKAGMEAVTQNMASKGLLNSGSTLKALTQWGQDNAQKYRDNYMNQLLGGSQVGAGVLGDLMGASNNSAQMLGDMRMAKAQAKGEGIGNFLNFGLGVAGMASDRRLKKDIKRIGTVTRGKGKGLPLHSYRYKGEPKNAQPHIGVMAQDVKRKVPKALGPQVGNFMTVDYRELVG